MAPPKRKLALPAALLKEMGTEQSSQPNKARGHARQLSRKDQRKAQRVQKRTAHSQSSQDFRKRQHSGRPGSNQPAKPLQRQDGDLGSNEDFEDDENLGQSKFDDDEDDDENDDEDMDLDLDLDSADEPAASVSKSSKKIDPEDARIAELERKLGIKGRKKSSTLDQDGLDAILGDLGDEDDETTDKKKRKSEADEWLAQKRRKAEAAARGQTVAEAEEDEDDEMDSDELDEAFDEEDATDDGKGEEDDDAFAGFSDNDEPPAPRQRENPYVAPTTGVAKYIPPSLRKKENGSGDQAEAQLQRRIQGLINRLTNDSMIGITKDILGLYANHPRQSVTSNLMSLVLALVSSPEKRPDAFFTMIAGFLAAAHKAMGTAMAAHLVQQLVEDFGKSYEAASGDQSDAPSKHLISLLAELYNMQVISCNLVFDYIRLFLQSLSELDTELLLRIIQTCGSSLRRDDPHALQDIVKRIGPAKTRKISVRTSFMIEEITKLQSNKNKAAARNKELADQRTQTRKKIATLNSTQDNQPLRIGLKDIQEADKNGKWWLVGASWSGNRKSSQDAEKSMAVEEPNDAEDFDFADDDDLGIPDLWQLAREQGFNTEVRQRIFVALHAATDCENAELLLKKLSLNKHQRKEIPEVIIRSGEAQAEYNPYYALVATRFCSSKELAFQFRCSLTTRFRKMGEDVDFGAGENDEYDNEDESEYDIKWLYNAAKIYGVMVARQALKLDLLKYRNLAALQEKAHWFVEVMLIAVLQECGRNEALLRRVFADLDPELARGLLYFIQKHVRTTDLLKEKKEKKAITKNCTLVEGILEASLTEEVM